MPHESPQDQELEKRNREILTELVGQQAARRLLQESSSLTALGRESAARLQQIAGLSTRAARRLKASFQLAEALMQDSLPIPFKIERTSDVPNLMREHFRLLKTEELHVILLDANNGFMRDVHVRPGSATSTGFSTASIFQPAVEFNAASIILVHNHPCLSPEPSEGDIRSTQKVYEAGNALGVPVLDHVIIGAPCSAGKKDYFSFKESGRFPDQSSGQKIAPETQSFD